MTGIMISLTMMLGIRCLLYTSPEVRSFWDNAAYHTGNMEAYFLTGNENYRAYSEAWAIHNEWKGAKDCLLYTSHLLYYLHGFYSSFYIVHSENVRSF